jgi:hypothetical protein
MASVISEKKSPQAEAATEANGEAKIPDSEDIAMEDEAEKMQRATRQSVYPCILGLFIF